MKLVDPDAIHRAARRCGGDSAALEASGATPMRARRQSLRIHPAAKGARRLRTIALGYISAAGARDAPALAKPVSTRPTI
jgi:aminopeptidase N